MSLECNIIDQSALEINGGQGAYGGVASSFSFTFGGLNAGMRASLSISGKNLGSPLMGDSLDISMLGGGFKMDIASYSKGKDSLTINLVDISHRILDHGFVVLNDGTATVVGGVNPVGAMRTPDTAEMAGSTVHKPFTAFRKGVAGDPGLPAAMGTDDPFGGKTVKDALQDVFSGEMANFLCKYEGSFREVISKMSQDQGVMPYWDMLSNTVKTLGAEGIAGGGPEGPNGGSLVEDIADACVGEVSITESEDFTGTITMLARGNLQQNIDKDSEQESAGGKTTRFFRCILLDPDFHVGTCGSPSSDVLLDFESEDLQKAITASTNDKIFGAYVIQSVLASCPSPEAGTSTVIPGRGGSTQTNDTTIDENFPKKDSAYQTNKFLSDYYNGGLSACKPKLRLASTSESTQGTLAIQKRRTEEKASGKTGGKADIDIANCNLLIQDAGTFNSILSGKGQLDASDDTLKEYLRKILNFKNRYYVIKGQTAGVPTYKGFLLTAESASGAANLTAPDGYKVVSCNPFLPISECGITSIRELATIASYMYTDSTDCGKKLASIRTGDFIDALWRNSLPDIIEGGGAGATDDAEESAKNKTGGFQMYLLERDTDSTDIPSWSTVTEICEKGGKITTTPSKPKAIIIAESIRSDGKATPALEVAGEEGAAGNDGGSGPNGDGPVDAAAANIKAQEIAWKGINILTISKDSIGEELSPISIAEATRTVKIWYDVKQMPSTFCQTPKDANGEDLDPGKRVFSGTEGQTGQGAWKAGLNSFSVSPSDVYTPSENPPEDDYESKECNPSETLNVKIWGAMVGRLKKILETNAWVDLTTATSKSITYQASSGGPTEIPDYSTGVESINISSSDGKTTVTISTGNARFREAVKVLRDSVAKAARKGSAVAGVTPDLINAGPNPQFSQLYRGGR